MGMHGRVVSTIIGVRGSLPGVMRAGAPASFGLLMKSSTVTDRRSSIPDILPWIWAPAVVARRLPLTVGLTTAMLATAIATGALTHHLTRSTRALDHFGYGLPALQRGEYATLLTSLVVALSPRMLATIASFVVGFVAPYEWFAGARRAVLIFLITQLGGFLLTSLVAWPLGALHFGWGEYLATTRDVGASAGAFGCAGALLWCLPAPWRRPATLALAGALAMLLLFSHHIWDVEHAIAAPLGYGLGAWLEGRR